MFLTLERWQEEERAEDREGRRKTEIPEEYVRVGAVWEAVLLELIEKTIIRGWLQGLRTAGMCNEDS